MCAGWGVCRRGVQPYYFKISNTLSGIFGPHWGYLPRVIALVLSNNYTSSIADYKSIRKIGLSLFETNVSGGNQGQDNKLDTYKVAQLGSNVLSRISQHLLGKLNVITGSPYWNDCQKPYAYFKLEDKNAQGPKITNSNTYILQPRDLTAYKYNLYLMRGRSFHSSTTFACDPLAWTPKGTEYFLIFTKVNFVSSLSLQLGLQLSLQLSLQLNSILILIFIFFITNANIFSGSWVVSWVEYQAAHVPTKLSSKLSCKLSSKLRDSCTTMLCSSTKNSTLLKLGQKVDTASLYSYFYSFNKEKVKDKKYAQETENAKKSQATENAKESSRKSLTQSNHDSNNKDTEYLNLTKGIESPLSVSSWVQNELIKYKSKNNIYNGIIHIIANPLFLQACYYEIKSKPVNKSKSIHEETLEGINQKWFENIASEIKTGKFNFTPTSRLHIPKAVNKEFRPLIVGNPREKIVKKALTVLMEAIWNEKLSDKTHGLRPVKSLHKALFKLYRQGSNYNWVIKGDISKNLENIPPKIIMKGFESNTTCDKTLQLIRKLLKAGYNDCNSGEHIQTILGIPPSVYSSLLTNILLNELDKKVLDLKNSFEKGKKRARNKEYDALTSRIQSLNKLQPGFNIITKERAIKRRSNPSLTASETNLRRLMYIRYADDFVILIKGTIDDAKHIKHLIADILTKKCGLDLHDDNTLITATKEGFKFLGAWCVRSSTLKTGVFKCDKGNTNRYRMRMRIEIPINDLINKLKINKLIKINANDKPVATARKDIVNLSHHEIVSFFNLHIQRVVTFYKIAVNITSLRKIIMLLHLSCALTLALKHKLRTQRQAFKKFGRNLDDPETGIKLEQPSVIKVKHLYRGTKSKKPD